MSKGVIIAAAIAAASVAVVLALIWRSREGYEDREGFHAGSPDASPRTRKKDESKVA